MKLNKKKIKKEINYKLHHHAKNMHFSFYMIQDQAQPNVPHRSKSAKTFTIVF